MAPAHDRDAMTGAMTRTIAYVPDLMDRSRLSAVAAVTFVASPDALVAAAAESGAGVGADLIVVDLGRPGVLAALAVLAEMGATTIGFASHIDRELLAAAKAAGCGRVMARSAFFGHVSELLSGSGPAPID